MQKSNFTKTIWTCIGLLILSLTASKADTYYSIASTGNPTSLTAWTNSLGANPANFTGGDTFIIQSGHNYTIPFNTSWTVNATTAGTAATVQVNSGGTLTFTLSSGSTCSLYLGGNLVRNGTLAGTTTSTTGTIDFTSNGSWTGSGDISGAKLAIQVDSGVTLDASGMSAGFKLKSSNTIGLKVYGSLITGTLTINGNGNSGAYFTLYSGATLTTATTSGSGLPGIFTGFSAGKITLDPAANYGFNGASAQVTGTTANNATMPAIVHNLTFNNSAGVTLSQATEVDGTLALTAGVVTGNVTLGASATISGGGSGAYINGLLSVYFAAPSSVSFTFPVGTASGYSPISLANFTDSGSGNLTASATAAQHPNQASSGIDTTLFIKRYWTLTGTGFISPTYNFTGTFVAGDNINGANTANLVVRKWDGAWTSPASSSSTSTTATGTGFTIDFGDFAAGEIATLPVVVAATQTAIADTSATLGATITADNGSTVTNYGVVWSTSPTPTMADHQVQVGTSVTLGNPFTANVTGLPAATTIYYRGYAISAAGTGYSTNASFTTLTNEPTVQASGVTGSSLQNGNLTVSWTRGDGARCIVLVKAGSAVDANPVDGTSYTGNASFGAGSMIGSGNYVAYLGTGNTVTLTTLATATTYYVAVYELNGSGALVNYLTTTPAAGNATTVTSPVTTLSWTGSADSDWNNTNNWDYLQLPDVGTPAVIYGALYAPIYSNQMAAASFGSVDIYGMLEIDTNGFNINGLGLTNTAVTVEGGGILTVGTNGVLTATNGGPMSILNSGSMIVAGQALVSPVSTATLALGGALAVTNGGALTLTGGSGSTLSPGGVLTINTNGAMSISNSSSFTMPTPTTGISPEIDVNGGSLILANNSGTFFMGDNSSSDTGIGAIFNNNGGNVVINQQLRVRCRDSKFTMTGGTLDLQGGLNHDVEGNDGRQFFTIAGGQANLNAVTIYRATTSAGLSVEGGVVNSSSIRIGIGIASANSRMTGGIWTNAGAFYIGDRNNAATSGTRNPYFTMNGGYLVTSGADGIIINNQGETSATGVSGNGAYLVVNNGTITTAGIQLNGPSVTANSYARFQLNGGTIYLGTVGLVANTAGSSMSAVFTITGGTLAAKNDWTSSANLPLSGTLTFQAADESTAAHNITLNGNLSGGAGNLVKTGAGTLTLNGANSYGGVTTISAGTLALGASATSASSEFDVNSGATLDASALSGFTFGSGQTLAGAGSVIGSVTNDIGSSLIPGDSIGTITFANDLTELGGVNNVFELASDSNDLVEVTGNLVLQGTNDLNVVVSGGVLSPGTYDLFHYAGTLTGDVTNLNLIGVPGYLTNRTDVQMISLVTTGLRAPTSIVWVGNATENTWDILNHTNWLNGVSLDSFVNTDTVRFDDTGAANPNVNVAANLLINSMTVDSTANYSFSGPGSIGGSGGLTKTNTGTLSLLLTNDYSGPTAIQQGTLQINNVADGGFASSLGSASSDPANLVLGGGATLRYLGSTASMNRGATLNDDAGGTIEVSGSSTLTVSGNLVGSALTKAGPGVLSLTAGNSYTNGTTVAGGVLSLGTSTSAGTGGITNLNGSVLRIPASYTMGNNLNFSGNCAIDLNNTSGTRNLNGEWTGNATILITNLYDAGSTFTIGGNGGMSTLSGVIDFVDTTGFLRFNDGGGNPSTGSQYVYFKLGSGNLVVTPRNGGVTIDMGALSGGPNTVLRGRASGSSGGVLYSVGALGIDSVFAGSISNSTVSGNLTALAKVGSGKLTLTGTSVHTDTTTVYEGELQVDGAILNSVVNVNAGTLSGTGTFGQTVTVSGTLSPGDAGIGSMTMNQDLNIYGTAYMEVDKGANTNDMVAGINNLTYSGSLIVTNLSGTLTNGTVFKLFSAQTYIGDFYGGITLPELAPGLSWQTNLTVDGTIRIAPLTNSPVVSSVVSGSNLTLSWPETYTGWTLEVQTNDLATGLTGAWSVVPNSDTIHSYSAPIDPANPSVFYRLIYTP